VGIEGTNGDKLAQFSNPMNISIGDRGIYVADTGNNRIESFSLPLPDGLFSIAPSTIRFSLCDNFSRPAAVAAVNNLTNEIFFVADTGNNRIILFNSRVDSSGPIMAVWNDMTTRLSTGDLSGAVSDFAMAAADDYQQGFLSVGTENAIIAINQIGNLTPVYILEDKAEYYFQQTNEGQTISFPVEFVRENGKWKIMEF